MNSKKFILVALAVMCAMSLTAPAFAQSVALSRSTVTVGSSVTATITGLEAARNGEFLTIKRNGIEVGAALQTAGAATVQFVVTHSGVNNYAVVYANGTQATTFDVYGEDPFFGVFAAIAPIVIGAVILLALFKTLKSMKD